MPFVSKAQERAAFAGGLGPEMKAKAEEFARATPDQQNLPERIGKKKDSRVHRGGTLAQLARG